MTLFPDFKGAVPARLLVIFVAAFLQLLLVADQFALGRYLGVTVFLGIFPLYLLIGFAVWLARPNQYLDALIFMSFLIGAALLVSFYYLDTAAIYSLVGNAVLSFLYLDRRLARKFVLLVVALLVPVALYQYEWQQAIADIFSFSACILVLNYWLFQLKTESQINDRLSLTDKESGAFEEFYFLHLLEQEFERQRRGESECSFIAIALEHDQLVEIYGWAAVSAFLPDLVSTLRGDIRAGDEVLRLSPDVFVLMLPACPEDNAGILMERIKRKITKKHWEHIHDLDVITATATTKGHESAEATHKDLMNKLSRQKRVSLDASSF